VIHDTASTGFSRSADAYERGRPEYPQAAIDWLVPRLGATVLDLAAGTGKLTRPLVAAGLDVVAVEPLAEMRALLPDSVRALEGTAEAIPLQDAAVHGVVVGQAFHWFDGDAALAEIHRVLRPDGLLAVVWNRRDMPEDPLDEIIDPYRGDVPTHLDDSWRAPFARTTLFGDLATAVFASEQLMDADMMEARVASISFIASLDEPERAAVVERARALAGEGTLVVPYRTEVLACRRS
jgi:SAM-dependent methyltransferase